MNAPGYILCNFWEKRSAILDCVKVECSECRAALAIDRKNAPLGFAPLCLECASRKGPMGCGGVAWEGKMMSIDEAIQAAARKIASCN